jgi:hypothetical protein
MFQAHLAMAGNQTQEKFEDTKGVIRSNKPKEDRQHNGKKKKQRSTKHHTEIKDGVTRTQLKTGE